MLSGTSVSPPQLDEFFAESEAPIRAQDFSELGWTEATPGGVDDLCSQNRSASMILAPFEAVRRYVHLAAGSAACKDEG